mmetsp:Transcript_56497/g.128439  ORF Transcript_56497/g.128439 Transcript_56497/m.128439 type:complete len:710 (-) Transcript_56497:284-2413(-)
MLGVGALYKMAVGHASGSSAESQELHPGQHVTLQRLAARPDLNGEAVEVIAKDPPTGKWRVKDKFGMIFILAAENLDVVPCGLDSSTRNPRFQQLSPSPPVPGQRMVVAGLDEGDLMGLEVEVVGLAPLPGMWQVKDLNSGTSIAVPVQFLTPIGDQTRQPHIKGAFEQWCDDTFASCDPPKDELTILLLGETGSGKSAFMNLLCNFPIVLRHGSEGVAQRVRDFRDLTHENDVNDSRTSKTDAVTEYKLAMGPLRLRIVDTPGFGHTGGPEVGKKHAKCIVDSIRKLGGVHAITIVFSGSQARVTPQLKSALFDIRAILPEEAWENIVVVFTNTPSRLHLTFGIEDLNKLLGHTVTPERQIFIDNPYVLWERSIQNQDRVDGRATCEDLAKAFTEAGHNLGNFVSEVVELPRLDTDEFRAASKQIQEKERLDKLHHKEKKHPQGVSVAYLHAKFKQRMKDDFPDFQSFADLGDFVWGEYGNRKDPPVDLLRHGTLIDPADGLRGVSLCHAIGATEDRADVVGDATLFVSWVWRYNIENFIDALYQYCCEHYLDPGRTFVWVCFFCNNQRLWLRPAPGAAPPLDVFGKTLRRIKRMICVLDCHNDPLYFKRVWTVYEVFVALHLGIKIEVTLFIEARTRFRNAVKAGDIGGFAAIDVMQAGASVPSDAEKIKEELRRDNAGPENVNRLVHNCVREGLQLLAARCLLQPG